MIFLKNKIQVSYFKQKRKSSLIFGSFLIPLVLCCLSGCKTQSYLEENICAEGIPTANRSQKPGPITVQFKIDSVQFGDYSNRIDSLFSLRINKESKLIILNNNLAIKLFHIESKEYGNNIHELKYDVFVKQNGCWRIWTRHGHSITSNPKLGSMTFSGTLKIPEKEVFIRVVWALWKID